MPFWEPKKIAEAAEEVVKVARVTENVKALQDGQKEIANAIAAISDRIRVLEIEMRVLKSETTLEAVKETQQMVNSVQGAFHDKLTELYVRVSHLEKTNTIVSAAPLIAMDNAKRRRRSPAKQKENPPGP